jgi:hypothetical protein
LHITDIPFSTTDWSSVPRTEHTGTSGMAYWRTKRFGILRVRMVEYTPGYVAAHWCTNCHILLCLEGELHTELQDGRRFVLTPGISYQVADDAEPHRSSAPIGALRLKKLVIIHASVAGIGQRCGMQRDCRGCGERDGAFVTNACTRNQMISRSLRSRLIHRMTERRATAAPRGAAATAPARPSPQNFFLHGRA